MIENRKYTQEEVDDLIDRDRVKGFLTLARNLPLSAKMAIMTADQARSLARLVDKSDLRLE